MTLHEIMTTALTHPIQVLCVGMIVFREVHAAVSVVWEKWRIRRPDSGSRPARALPSLDVSRGAEAERDDLRFTDFRRPTAAEPTAGRVAM